MYAELKQWLNVATPAARNIVRKILLDAKEPLHTQEIFKRSQKDFPLQPEEEERQTALHAKLLQRQKIPPPPNPIHHIRSIKYLKSVVLPDLQSRHEIVKVHRERPPTSEECEMFASPPPKRTKRKITFSPGQQLPRRTSDGLISEWVWRFKTPEEVERDNYYEQRNREWEAHKEQQRKEASIRAVKAKHSRHPSAERSQREHRQPGLV